MPARSLGEISVVITGNDEIRLINRRHLGKDSVTDVISFLYPPIPGEQGKHGAELFINAEVAFEEGAKRRNWGPSRELALYLAHGCNHLTGAGDYNRASVARMRRRELAWLKKAAVRGLTKDLIKVWGKLPVRPGPAPRQAT